MEGKRVGQGGWKAQTGRQEHIEWNIVELRKQFVGNLRTKEEMTRLRIIQINDENKKLAESIISSLECLKEAGTRIKLKAKEKIKEFVYSLHSEEAASKLIRIGDLSVYLSKQKQFIAKTLDKTTQNKSSAQLHELLSQCRYQDTLSKLEQQQLCEQIRYIKSNVLVNNTLVYEPTAILLCNQQQKSINSKLQSSLQQLERVSKLQIICLPTGDYAAKKGRLDKQEQRLKRMQRMIDEERRKIDCFEKFMRHECYQALQKLPLPVCNVKDETVDDEESQAESVPDEQLTDLLQLKLEQCSEAMIANRVHPYEKIQENVKILRSKIKKLESQF